MTSRNVEVSDIDRAGQAVPASAGDESDVQLPGAEISLDKYGHRANLADVVEQHRGVPRAEDDYDR